MDSALRMASVAFSGPAETTVTTESPPSRSLMSSASSTARSLISSSTASAASRSSVKSPSVSLRSDQVSGTCLIRTAIFVMSLRSSFLFAVCQRCAGHLLCASMRTHARRSHCHIFVTNPADLITHG
ncbi:Uncharacterised protein [Mycobacteroides abscessus subsp. abscessus]|nr:Uncharacterised protein [Mycobacteroides abscessus subsp. abscessus]